MSEPQSQDVARPVAREKPPNDTGGNGAAPASVECSACGHVGEPQGRGQCQQCGCWLPSNAGHLVHGGRSRQPLANPEDAPLFQEWARDLGGVESLSTGARVLLRRAAEADLICSTALSYVMESRESVTSARVLKSLDVLAKHSQTLLRVASLLGVKPEPKDVWR